MLYYLNSPYVQVVLGNHGHPTKIQVGDYMTSM